MATATTLHPVRALHGKVRAPGARVHFRVAHETQILAPHAAARKAPLRGYPALRVLANLTRAWGRSLSRDQKARWKTLSRRMSWGYNKRAWYRFNWSRVAADLSPLIEPPGRLPPKGAIASGAVLVQYVQPGPYPFATHGKVTVSFSVAPSIYTRGRPCVAYREWTPKPVPARREANENDLTFAAWTMRGSANVWNPATDPPETLLPGDQGADLYLPGLCLATHKRALRIRLYDLETGYLLAEKTWPVEIAFI